MEFSLRKKRLAAICSGRVPGACPPCVRHCPACVRCGRDSKPCPPCVLMFVGLVSAVAAPPSVVSPMLPSVSTMCPLLVFSLFSRCPLVVRSLAPLPAVRLVTFSRQCSCLPQSFAADLHPVFRACVGSL